MARIRSVHPGFFTDEHFVSCSPFARLLAIGIWTECDDRGIFEWKPLTLKMRLMAADAVDVPALLDELTAANLITKFEHEHRSFGAVRNFVRFQRPKKPKYTHVIPAELRPYVGIRLSDSEPTEHDDEEVPHEFPTGGGNPPQREEGGWRGGGREDHVAFVPEPAREEEKQKLFEVVWKGFPKAKTESKPQAKAAFEQLTIEEMKGFAGSIASIAEDIQKKKLDIPYNLPKFISGRKFEGFLASSTLAASKHFKFHRDTPQGRAHEADRRKRTGIGVPWRDDHWWFETEWPPGHERSLGAA